VNPTGYIDLQVNGCRGVDFSAPDLTADRFVSACQTLVASGTAGFLATLITSPVPLYERNLRLMTTALRWPEVRNCVLGFHLEGPFISPADGARGAHRREWVRLPDVELLRRLQDWAGGQIKIITLAAELPGACEFIRAARALGITVSLGHQLATAEQIRAAVDAGATLVTHLGNGLPHQLDRFNNPLWECLANDALTALVIADGHHVPAPMLKAMLRAKGVDRFIVTSDASPLALLPPGRYEALGNPCVLDASGRLYNPVTGYFVGSASTMRECVQHLASLGWLTADELATVSVRNPRRVLGRLTE
jgi:N-acetylglucosamine-6-phosphate deacetylase